MTIPSTRAQQLRKSLRPSLRSPPWFVVALALVVGLAAGIGGFTFRYANGLSYFKSDPRACVNCHIMQSQFSAWQHSSHRAVAVCIDCHLPHALVPKYLAKAENGFRHAKLFTTQSFVEPIVVQPAGKQILQDNCVRCHDAMVDALVHHTGTEAAAPECVHCHAGVGHVARAGLGGPLRAHETAPSSSPPASSHP
jgi:cytochrome c nitrite reductase small subunit